MIPLLKTGALQGTFKLLAHKQSPEKTPATLTLDVLENKTRVTELQSGSDAVGSSLGRTRLCVDFWKGNSEHRGRKQSLLGTQRLSFWHKEYLSARVGSWV